MKDIYFCKENEEYGCFSNFYGIDDDKFKLIIDGIQYRTTEHYYQCMKFDDGTSYGREYMEIVRESDTPYKSKILGHLGLNAHRNFNTWRVSKDDRRFIKDVILEYLNKGVKMRDDFEENKIDIMYKCVYKKFKQNKHLKKILLSTGDRILIENAKYDSFWGIGKGNGQNNLGKILMRVRTQLENK